MKTVVLCGGAGTRLSEETVLRPKPMVAIGGRPILWHILNIYSHFGFNDFVLALGYKADFIKEYFLNYYALNSDFTVDLSSGEVRYEAPCRRNWKVRLVDTGSETLTGGRLKRLQSVLQDETFLLTYGDGVANVDVNELVSFHRAHGKLATVTAVRPKARFGNIAFNGNQVTQFREKAQSDAGWINGGFFVMEPRVFDYLNDGDQTVLEASPLENLATDGQLMAYRHDGFWECMDTLRDRHSLEEKWSTGSAPWKVWKD